MIKNGQWHIFPLIPCGFHGKMVQWRHLWSPQQYSNFLCGESILAVRLPSLHIQPVASTLSMQSIESSCFQASLERFWIVWESQGSVAQGAQALCHCYYTVHTQSLNISSSNTSHRGFIPTSITPCAINFLLDQMNQTRQVEMSSRKSISHIVVS